MSRTGFAPRPASAGRGRAWRPLPAFLLLFALLAPVRAEIYVTPVTQEVIARPGQVDSGAFLVRNSTSSPTVIRVQVVSYHDYVSGNRDAGSPPWLQVTPDSFLLEPGQAGLAEYRLTMPEEASGELMAMVFFSEAPRSGAMITGRIGAAFYAMAAGTLTPRLSLGRIQPVLDGQGKNRFYLELSNPGNVHVRPRGDFEVTDSSGLRVATTDLAPGRPILPGGAMRYSTSPLPQNLPAGDYTVRWHFSTGAIGSDPGANLAGETPFRIE